MSANIIFCSHAHHTQTVSNQHTGERFAYYGVTHDGAAKEKQSLGHVALGSDLR